MTSQSWPSFDEDLRIRLQNEEKPCAAPRANDAKHVVTDQEEDELPVASELGNRYTNLTKCIYESIKQIVPEQKWIQSVKKTGG